MDRYKKIRLAVVLPSLAGGGMERVRLQLVREWRRRGIEVDLVLARADGAYLNDIPDGMQVFTVARLGRWSFPLGVVGYFLKRRPSHVLSAADDVNAITLYAARLCVPRSDVVISIHNHVATQYAHTTGFERHKSRLTRRLMKHAARHAKAVVAVSRGVANNARDFFCLERTPEVILNPVDLEAIHARIQAGDRPAELAAGSKWIVFLGRFVQQKGLDVLLQAFRRVREQDAGVCLALVGEGPLHGSLVAEAEDIGVDEYLIFPGFVDQPYAWIQAADVLVLPSRFEGLGNVLIEALACGTQVVAADCPSGPAEILDNGRYGQLVPVGDSVALAGALLRALRGDFRVPPNVLKQRANMFSVTRAAERYLDVLTGVVR